MSVELYGIPRIIYDIPKIIYNNIDENIYKEYVNTFNELFKKIRNEIGYKIKILSFTGLSLVNPISNFLNKDVDYRPIYYVDVKKYGIILGVLGTILTATITTEFLSSYLTTSASALKAYIDVGYKYGYSKTLISISGTNVPYYITIYGTNLAISNIYNDFEIAYKTIKDAGDYFKFITTSLVIFSLLYFANKHS